MIDKYLRNRKKRVKEIYVEKSKSNGDGDGEEEKTI